jgi:hypothetical protein
MKIVRTSYFSAEEGFLGYIINVTQLCSMSYQITQYYTLLQTAGLQNFMLVKIIKHDHKMCSMDHKCSCPEI